MKKNNNKNTFNTSATENNNTLGGMNAMNNTYFGGNDMNAMDSFVTDVKDVLKGYLGDGYGVETHAVIKNNDVRLTGLCISRDNSNIAPTIYLDDLYKQFEDGEMDMDEVCRTIIRIFESSRLNLDLDVSQVRNLDYVRDRICFKIVGTSHNQDLLANAPHRIVADDLAVVFFIAVSQDHDGVASITIRNDLFETWDISVDDLYDIALDNTPRMFEGRIRPLFSVLADIMGKSPEMFDGEFYDMAGSDMIPMYVCCNNTQVNGASAILYKGLLQSFADSMGTDLYIIPSSIHETLLVPVGDSFAPEGIKEIISQVNSTVVAPTDILSDGLYVYHRDSDSIERV